MPPATEDKDLQRIAAALNRLVGLATADESLGIEAILALLPEDKREETRARLEALTSEQLAAVTVPGGEAPPKRFDEQDARILVEEIVQQAQREAPGLFVDEGLDPGVGAQLQRAKAFIKQSLFTNEDPRIPSFTSLLGQQGATALDDAMAAFVSRREEQVNIFPNQPLLENQISAYTEQLVSFGVITAEQRDALLEGRVSANGLLDVVLTDLPRVRSLAEQNAVSGDLGLSIRNLRRREPPELQAQGELENLARQ